MVRESTSRRLAVRSSGNAYLDTAEGGLHGYEALIVIDLQNDFCPGGALAVAGGDEIVPLINDLVA